MDERERQKTLLRLQTKINTRMGGARSGLYWKGALGPKFETVRSSPQKNGLKGE